MKDRICYAGERVPVTTITDAKHVDGKMRLANFLTGEKRFFDTTKLNTLVKDYAVFSKLVISHDTITCNNEEIDTARLSYQEAINMTSENYNHVPYTIYYRQYKH